MRVNMHMNVIDIYRNVFYGYSAIGVLKLILAVILSAAVEAHDEAEEQTTTTDTDADEQAPLLSQPSQAQAPLPATPKKQLRAKISRGSVPIVASLCALFALDSFASGLAPL